MSSSDRDCSCQLYSPLRFFCEVYEKHQPEAFRHAFRSHQDAEELHPLIRSNADIGQCVCASFEWCGSRSSCPAITTISAMLAKVVTISVQAPNIMSAANDRYLDDAQNCADARKKINTRPSAPKSGKARHENRISVGFDRRVNGVRNTQPPDPIVETRPVNRAPVATTKLQIENNRAEPRRA
jgi:hypothetical protein